MEILIIILGYTITAITFFFIGKSFSKIIKPTSEELIKYTIDNVKFVNELNPIVKLIYLQFIDKEQVKYFFDTNYHLHIKNLEMEIWSANDWYSRFFCKVPDELLKKHNLTLKELNNKLSVADKKVLDYIVQAVKINNKEFIDRLFL